jgi:putative ABC transport system permease protein
VGQILTAETGTGAAGRYRVAGVLAPSFLFPNSFAQPDLLTPLVLTEPQRTDRTQRNFQAFVRLPPDVPLADYQARFNDVGRAGRAEIPDTRLNGGLGYWDVWAILPLIERMGAGQRRVFSTVFAAAAVLVLLGCLNVSGLVAARGVDRLRELTLRRALGAGAHDIARLVLAECLALIALGCAIGVALSEPLVRVVLRLLPPNIGLLRDPGLDWRVVAFVAIAAAVSTLLVSLWPLRRSLRAQPAGALGGGGAATSRSFGRAVVIAAQVAIALVLTLGGALVVASLITVWRTDIGYSTDQLLVVDGTTTVTTPPARVSAVREFVDRVRQIPGVIAAGATQAPMLRSGSPGGEFRADTYQVSAGFFDAVNMPPVEGRLLTRDEIDGGAPVAVVSRTFAAKHLGDGPAVGRSITPPRGTTSYTIVGLVDDARYASWDSQGMHGGQFYRPLTNAPRFTVAIRLGTERDAVLQDVLRLDAADATLRLARAAMAGDLLQETVRARRFQSWLFGSFSAASLVIVAAGILGLVASTAARRTREVGIRIALGSTGRQVVALLLREQLRPVAAGLAAGGLLSWWAVTYVRSYLYGVTMYDAMVWTIAALVIASVSAIAVLIPALRLSRTDAVQALRVE